jgi:hypothetical protein
MVVPAGVLDQAIAAGRSGSGLAALEQSPLGRVLAAGIRNLMRAAKQLSEDASKTAETPGSTPETKDETR